jgi:hypothetical protein
MAVANTGSLALYLVSTFSNLPGGISGTMYQTVDFQRMWVAQYTGQNITSDSIAEIYQPPILNLAMANLVNLKISNGDGGTVSLGEMSNSDQGALKSADAYRDLAMQQLKALPRAVSFVRSLS